MRDADVRNALCRKVFADHIRDPATLVVPELGLLHGGARVDIAVVNGRFHGFEIKSEADTLVRLPTQIEAYNGVFDRVTIVAGRRHIDEIDAKVPRWWGIKVAIAGTRGAIHFDELRSPKQNPSIDPVCLAGLLWRDEAIAALQDRQIRRVRSKTRAQLARILAASIPLHELRDLVRQTLKTRANWRSDAPRVPHADSSQPSAKLPDFLFGPLPHNAR